MATTDCSSPHGAAISDRDTRYYGGRFFVVHRETVLADLAAQVDQGAAHITFGDPDFFNGPKHGMAIVRELHRMWPALTFDVTIKISHLLAHRALLAELSTRPPGPRPPRLSESWFY